jgi:hypothetical protein
LGVGFDGRIIYAVAATRLKTTKAKVDESRNDTN